MNAGIMESNHQEFTRSRELLEKARQVAPGGIHSGARKFHEPVCWDHGKGSKVFDLDGNEFLDYICGWGAIVHGHCDEELNAAVKDALDQYDLYGVGTTELEYEATKAVKDRVPSADRVLFGVAGSEVTAHAARLARAVTGCRKIIKFQGHYNGWYDSYAMNHETDEEELGTHDPFTAGILPEVIQETIVLPYNDLAAVEAAVEAHGDDIAAVILEPIAHNMGCILPEDGFLEGLRDITEANDILLIFDEVITGFRHDVGGVQKQLGVTPDLTTMGKAAANGYPASILCGKEEYMEQFKMHGGTMTGEEPGTVMFGGTFNAQAASVAAIKHCIELIESRNLHDHTKRMCDIVVNGMEDILEDLGITATVKRYGGVWITYFTDGQLTNWRDVLQQDQERFEAFRKGMVDRGFLMTPMIRRNYISGSHTEEDMRRTVEAAEDTLRDITS